MTGPLGACVIASALGVVASVAHAEIPVVDLEGVVHAVSARHVVSAIERADVAKAPLLVLRLDTPGGLDSSMREIIDAILNCRTPVAVFVGPSGARAASAGFLITIAADVAAMAPGTNIGAAHPVSAMGAMDEVMAKKVTSDAAAYIRGKAERRGRNPEMAEKAVVESRSFTEREALDLKLIDLVANDVPDLLAKLDGREVKRFDGKVATLDLHDRRTVRVAMDPGQAILATIANPEVLFLLLLGALAGLGAEISHPGLLFPGIVGTVCLILFLFASEILPVSGAGVLLVVLAFGLFAAEAKVASHGLLTVGGLVSMMIGALMLVDSPLPEMQVPLRSVLPPILVVSAGLAMLMRLVVASRRLKPSTGAEGMIGRHARAETDLGPDGWVRVQGERWRAESQAPVGAGEDVEIVSVNGLRLGVRKG